MTTPNTHLYGSGRATKAPGKRHKIIITKEIIKSVKQLAMLKVKLEGFCYSFTKLRI